MESYVKTKNKSGVGYIEFFHPAHNSLPSQVLSELARAIANAGEDDSIKVIVLQSGGDRTFCAGASFEELVSITNEDEGKLFFSGFANVINAMRKCPKFIIGRVQGKTVGGGVGLAAATDFCMATKFADIKLSELNVGIGPFVVGPAVRRKLGVSAMSQIAMDADSFYSANWAMEKGLYAKVFDTTEELDAAVTAFTEKLKGYNPKAMSEMKNMFWRETEDWDQLLVQRAKISGRLVLSEFTKEKLKQYK
ncbi:enoyl-CoA hydratase/isomerase family protein [Subsaxibacter sp. CAU 1640]|uniref:enoyl-CoA hydratase/isomerase family protein n=1 Tax=Subsaxibacter sp. CAU 1640 TaxID=2933271 RepID=UPI002005B739|nr:enoyl-CoA hydratase/isomerase family protein [Subsaxibacter sp. CAU 1640]MCK7590286.1 enoyl-CoA hydratase/isomerase family protein [Subsaxibacter sp. CAU 1640]